ncbi:TetR/AcrR family transcriptional regulator [Yinghuangia seranimata]|uniref:TetR/AcrR family transcriptional regulator n=1 Tax=Yinghuangia seranimata TaxID=408067 RepID=UPI00248C9A02|nr:TetR/AcrR family transcriptional regulator [Yinghuangia seranimata]MDI2127209.1 TetR/AcrR family transcriptional regulator [Yinghuangia seranimata]
MPEPREDSPRRRELLAATLAYAAENNLSDLSLRPLSAAIGSSPRVLLYLFGSKEGLVREVLAAGRAEQLALIERAAREGDGPRATLELLWGWCADPGHRTMLRLFYEGYVRSAGASGEGPWRGFAAGSVTEWMPVLGPVLEGTGVSATLALGTLRGLLLDLLADDNSLSRVNQAWSEFLDAVLPEA